MVTGEIKGGLSIILVVYLKVFIGNRSLDGDGKQGMTVEM